jgi:peptide/nickel transport system ATP-binding protein
VTSRFTRHICSSTGFKPFKLKENFGFTYIFISHDLAVVKYMSDQVLVKGKIEEIADADALYANPNGIY